MNRLNISIYPAPVLRKKAAGIERITPELKAFFADMAAMMYQSDGVGLAAPQVGISLRVVTVDIGDGLMTLVNPRIISGEGEQTGIEGCLSFPRLHGYVTRAQRVVVRALNERGKTVTITAEDFLARAFQHEIDHLDGVLFTDRVEPDTLTWVTGETDADGNYIEKKVTLEEALAFFERQTAATR